MSQIDERRISFSRENNSKYFNYLSNINLKYVRPGKIINESFHESVSPVFIVGQIFCLFPVTGLLDKNVKNVKFKLLTFRNFISICFLVMGVVEGILSVIHLLKTKLTISRAGASIFYTVCMTGAYLLYRLSKRWGYIIQYWRAKEDVFLRKPYTQKGTKLKTKIRFVAFLMLFIAMGEHILYISSTFIYHYQQIQECGTTETNYLKFFLINERSHVFMFLNYNAVLSVFLMWLNAAMTFCWNYVDVFICVISIAISSRFDQINERLEMVENKDMPDSFWLDIRLHYIQIIEIVELIDTEISLIILLSCSTNLFYICINLFNSFTISSVAINSLYFWTSLLLLTLRTLCVLFFAALIHDTSKKPLSILKNIPTKAWNSEFQIFIDLVTSEFIALSGKRFFFLTRKMILAMVGTVVTYELVLLDDIGKTPIPNICNTTLDL